MTNDKELVPIHKHGKVVGYKVKGQVIEVALSPSIGDVTAYQQLVNLLNGLYNNKTILVTLLPSNIKVELGRKEYVAFLRGELNPRDATEDHVTVKRVLAPDCTKGDWGGVGLFLYGRLFDHLKRKAYRQKQPARH